MGLLERESSTFSLVHLLERAWMRLVANPWPLWSLAIITGLLLALALVHLCVRYARRGHHQPEDDQP